MSGHFRAFSFVDRITSLRDACRVEGWYVIPEDLQAFPSCLAAEAVGQLAAWAAMKATDFVRRPVAGLAGQVDLLGGARPGKVLELAVDIDSLDEEAISYRGAATIEGASIIQLEDCVGPMIPVTELDDPDALRKRFALLSGQGVPAGGFPGIPPLPFQLVGGEQGISVRAAFTVPSSASFFADHFPRRPVFPGSLLMQVCLELSDALVTEMPPTAQGKWRLESVLNMKLREFIPPGKELQLETKIKQRTVDTITLTVDARTGDEIVGGARLLARADNSR